MPLVQALLLYVCAFGVGEALLAAGPAAPRAVLSSYQIVLPFPGSGGAALFAPAAAPGGVLHHPFAPDAALRQPFGAFHAPAALVDAENLLERDVRPVTAYAAPAAPAPVAPIARPPQQAFYERAFPQQDDLAGRAEYSELPYASGAQPQPPSLQNPATGGRSGSFRNSVTSRVGQSNTQDSGYSSTQAANGLPSVHNAESRFASSHSANGLPSGSHRSSPVDSGFSSSQTDNALANQYFRPSEFINQAYQRTSQQPTEELSDRHFQRAQQNSPDFGIVQQQQQQQQLADPSAILQFQPFHSDEIFPPRSQATGRFNSYLFSYSYPREENQLLTPLVQNQIQQNRYNHVSNEYSSNLEGSYRQTNALSLPFNYESTSYSRSSPDLRPRLSIEASPVTQDRHQSYRVDVEGNGYGYRYAVQSSHNKNKEISARRQDNIDTVTPPSHHLN